MKVRYSEVVHSILYAPTYVALTKGFFSEVGLDVAMTAQGGDKSVAALLLEAYAKGFRKEITVRDYGALGPLSLVLQGIREPFRRLIVKARPRTPIAALNHGELIPF